jgi:hypothetical protein
MTASRVVVEMNSCSNTVLEPFYMGSNRLIRGIRLSKELIFIFWGQSLESPSIQVKYQLYG